MIRASSPRSRKYSPMVQPAYGAMYCIAAESEAVAATTMVYSIAPCSSSLRTTFAMVEAFWPIATLTQVRFLPFWLMIVSTATAVLPVWRSPMISSRWPRPIGTMESIAFRPVWTGSDTDWRSITPGATFSMTSVSFALIGPLPSMGWPSELTTRPLSSGPIGTSRIRPVALTTSPSEMWVYSPRTTAPTESRSRLSARPKVSPGNSIISPCITSERPWMRHMPSVTETTAPWFRVSADTSRFWILLFSSSLISAGFSCMKNSPALADSNLERAGELRELAAHRCIHDFVADPDGHPADQLGFDRDRRVDLAAEAALQRGHDLAELFLGQGVGRGDVRLQHPFVRMAQG